MGLGFTRSSAGKHFESFVILSGSVYALICALPVILKIWGPMGPGKANALALLGLALATLSFGFYFVFLQNKGLLRRSSFVIAQWILIGVSLVWVNASRSDRFLDIQLTERLDVRDFPLMTRAELAKEKFQNFHELYQELASHFQKHSSQEVNLDAAAQFWIMQLSSLWIPSLTNCILEQNDLPQDEKLVEARVEKFLQAESACCTDFANILAYFLREAGFESRLLVLPGHSMNELKLRDGWITVDAYNGIIFEGSWKEILSRRGPLKLKTIRREKSQPEELGLRIRQIINALDGREPIVFQRTKLPQFITGNKWDD